MKPGAWRTATPAALIFGAVLAPRDAPGPEAPPPEVSVDYDEDASAARVTAAIDISAPPQIVYAVMLDCSWP